MNNKPIKFLILKLLAGVFLCVGIVGIVLSVKGFGDFESNNFMLGGFMACFGIFAGFTCGAIGFMPEMSRFSVKLTKQVLDENKADMKDIADTQAEIHGDAVRTVATAVKEGLESEPSAQQTVYCKHCGQEIAADSRFCKFCGGDQ